MVCDPEVSRRNGAKSMGPTSERGKAIASRNAIKHGLLATKPPLLATEDLSTFEGLVQGLIDHYQPENPVEHFLVQQVAMGMLKQHRLWSVESAIANIEILKAQRAMEFPDHIIPGTSLPLMDFEDKHVPRKEVLKQEETLLKRLIDNLTHDLQQYPTKGERRTLTLFQQSLERSGYCDDRSAEVWDFFDVFFDWIATAKSQKPKGNERGEEAIAHANRLIELAKLRIAEIQGRLDEYEAIEKNIQQAEVVKQSIQNPDLFVRYQQTINRGMYEALDRLENLRERRNEGSMGSFG